MKFDFAVLRLPVGYVCRDLIVAVLHYNHAKTPLLRECIVQIVFDKIITCIMFHKIGWISL